MSVRPMRKLGDPVLRIKAKPVCDLDADTVKILDDMADSMEQYRGIGLAAPQIGVSLALVVVKLAEDLPLIELINPETVSCSGEEVDVEGCLSVPGIFGEVKRCTEVTVRYQDRTGEQKELKTSGLFARALQHEIDHLEGVLFIDKVINYVAEEE
jgi:peptide deformylase